MYEKNTSVIKFDSVAIPQPYEGTDIRDDKFVPYGIDNVYPNYILKLYNESPIHSSILNAKANYIIGDGLKYTNGTELNVKVNPADSFQELVQKAVKDYLIFNYFCIEVIYNQFNQAIEYHFIPAHKIRPNRSKTKFWFSEDFTQRTKPVVFDRWKENVTDNTSKIFFFSGYYASVNNVYPVPEYHGSLKSIQTDIEIRDFNLNNIKNHFSVSTLITFFRGSNVSDEIKRQVIADLKASYTGATGKKMIVDFQDPTQPSADVKNISPNDWDKAYDLVSKRVIDDIMIGHQVTSPMLFGVKTEGQLGGATELETAYEIFANTYVRNKRTELEGAFNMLFKNSELIKGSLVFADKQLFSARISEALKEKIYIINELRKEAGLEAMANGDRLLSESAPAVVPVQQSKFSKAIELTDEDFDKIKELGIVANEFEFLDEGEFITSKEDFRKVELQFETSQDIADYITSHDVSGMTLKDLKTAIRKDLGLSITLDELKSALTSISKSGLVDVNIQDNIIQVQKPKQDKPNRKIEVMYKYDVRDGLGESIIETTRPFCRRLIENSKLYTREEIQTMATIFGYDIYKYGGGYYHNPETGETTSFCRHQFKSKTVSRKTK